MTNQNVILKKPKMILFDYGQTLVNEAKFDGVKGTEAVLKYATANKYNRTAEEVQAVADLINSELGRFDPARRHLFQVEVPNTMFTRFLYESQGIELSISGAKLDEVFWNAAAPGVPTAGIKDFLDFLKKQGIRTGVISNISYGTEALKNRINSVLPENEFEFIIATSEYMFRKPNKHIFELALEKAGLQAEDVWYIGDQYECDVVGARNAGLFPVWYIGAVDFKQPFEKRNEVLAIDSWEVLKSMMEEINKIEL